MQSKSTLDNFVILKTLGSGYSGKVKLGQDKDSKQLYALKILNSENKHIEKIKTTLKNECDIMKNLNHVNVVKFIDIRDDGHYTSKSGKEKQVVYAIIELANKGEIFEVLYNVGPFNENLARFYFKQLVDALEYLHQHNVAHRDLKPENLLLDDNLNLKLADFGFATMINENKKNTTKLGTERYMAPELLYRKPYVAKKVDVFAMGVILFVFYSGHPPFHEGRLEDPYYNAFVKKPEKFWAFHKKQNKQRNYSQSFINLVNRMLALDPKERLTIEEIKNSEWVQEPFDSEKALKDMQKYVYMMNKVMDESKMQIEEEKEGDANQYRDIMTKTSKQLKYKLNDIRKVQFEQINKDSHMVPKITFQCNEKEQVVTKILKAVDSISQVKIREHTVYRGKVVWTKDKKKFNLKFFNEMEEIILVKTKLYFLGEGLYGLSLIRKKGNSFDFYEIKTALLKLIE